MALMETQVVFFSFSYKSIMWMGLPTDITGERSNGTNAHYYGIDIANKFGESYTKNGDQ